jgi:hypothetical protein
MTRSDPDYDRLTPVSEAAQIKKRDANIRRVISAAHALELDSPIIHYRIVGDRIELWTCHGGPYIYEAPKKTVRKKKP